MMYADTPWRDLSFKNGFLRPAMEKNRYRLCAVRWHDHDDDDMKFTLEKCMAYNDNDMRAH